MSRDQMVSRIFQRVHRRTLNLVPNTLIVSVVIAILASIIPLNFRAEMSSIGTLVAFLVVSIGVIVLRHREPDLPRRFKVPLHSVIPVLPSWDACGSSRICSR